MYYINSYGEGGEIIKYDDIAKKAFEDMLKYEVKDESLSYIMNKCIENQGEFTDYEKSKIEVQVIHIMSVEGYDIDCLKPFRLKKYRD